MNKEPYLKQAEYKKHLPSLESLANKLHNECLFDVTLPPPPCPSLCFSEETEVEDRSFRSNIAEIYRSNIYEGIYTFLSNTPLYNNILYGTIQLYIRHTSF